MQIDLAAVRSNLATIRRLAGPRRQVIAALKADAYGHGCATVAAALAAAGIDWIAVGSIADAAAIRAAGLRVPLQLLGAFEPAMTADVLALDLVPSVTDAAAALALAQAAGRRVAVFVKVDCGFGRFGIPLDSGRAAIAQIAAVDNVDLAGLYTHLPFSDAPGRAWAAQRLAAFDTLVAALARTGIRPRIVQARSSPGLLAGLEDSGNAVAVGHALFGLDAFGPNGAPAQMDIALQPALAAITTRLVHVGERPPPALAASFHRGAAGATAVVPIGICHGYRPTAADAFMVVNGGRAPIVRVCLENTILDIARTGGSAGTEALVLGRAGDLRIGIDDLARWQATSVLALLTGLGRSLARRYAD